MTNKPLALVFTGLAALASTGLGSSAAWSQPAPADGYRQQDPYDEYSQRQQRYEAQRDAYESQLRDYGVMRDRYERERRDYDARYGQGAYERYYPVPPPPPPPLPPPPAAPEPPPPAYSAPPPPPPPPQSPPDYGRDQPPPLDPYADPNGGFSGGDRDRLSDPDRLRDAPVQSSPLRPPQAGDYRPPLQPLPPGPPPPGSYRDPCRGQGAGIAAAAGVAVGSAAAERDDRAEGLFLGGLAGPIVGTSVGRAATRCDVQGYYYDYTQTVEYREAEIDRARRSGRNDYDYYRRLGCRLAIAPAEVNRRVDYRYVRVCPDQQGRYRFTD